VKIFGLPYDLRAEVNVLNGFSAHADQADLLDYVSDTKKHGDLDRVLLVHGDPVPQRILRDKLLERTPSLKVDVPKTGDVIRV